MAEFALALDIGGTFIKSAIVAADGSMVEKTFRETPVESQGPTETIIGTFIQIIRSALDIARALKLNVAGIGISTPGPFDYEKSASLMKHKLSSIYGIRLKQEFIQRLELSKDFSIRFVHDAHAFLMGEAWQGVAKGYNRVVGLTLGTGLGSAFMINNKIIDNGQGGPLYSIWSLPYQDGIVEDKISRRGIIARYKELAEKNYRKDLDVKEIASRGLKYKDKISLQVFEEVGSILGQILKPILLKFEAECLVLGGQISKAFPLFTESLKKQLQSVPNLKKITRAQLIDSAALCGAAKLVF